MNSRILSWLVPAVGALIGTLAGSFVAGYYSTSAVGLTSLTAIRSEAYKDFVNAQATYVYAGTEQMRQSAEPRIREAAARLAVFAPPEIVRDMAEFFRQSSQRPACVSLIPSDLQMYRGIRKSIIDKDTVSDADLTMVLFGCTG